MPWVGKCSDVWVPLCLWSVVEDAEVMPNEPGIGSSNGRKLRHVTFKLDNKETAHTNMNDNGPHGVWSSKIDSTFVY